MLVTLQVAKALRKRVQRRDQKSLSSSKFGTTLRLASDLAGCSKFRTCKLFTYTSVRDKGSKS
jgi:hypothetical protein